jgi:hypothetical protein
MLEELEKDEELDKYDNCVKSDQMTNFHCAEISRTFFSITSWKRKEVVLTKSDQVVIFYWENMILVGRWLLKRFVLI